MDNAAYWIEEYFHVQDMVLELPCNHVDAEARLDQLAQECDLWSCRELMLRAKGAVFELERIGFPIEALKERPEKA